MTFKFLQMERGKGSFPTQRKLEKVVSFFKREGREEFSLHGNNSSSKYKLGLSFCVLFLYGVLYIEIIVNGRVLMHCSKTDLSVRYLSHKFWIEFCWGSKTSPLFLCGSVVLQFMFLQLSSLSAWE